MLKSLAKPVLLALVIVVSVFGQGTTASPITVSITSPTSAVVTAIGPTISVSGTATGGARVTRVVWQTSNGTEGVASGADCWIASGIPVPEGTTTIVLRAYDSTGASAWVAQVVVRP